MTQTTALLLTLLVEVPLVAALVWLRGWAPGRMGQVALVAAGASLLTHPLLWRVADRVQTRPTLLVAEAVVALVESLVLRFGADLRLDRALLASFFANATSLGVGLLLQGTA